MCRSDRHRLQLTIGAHCSERRSWPPPLQLLLLLLRALQLSRPPRSTPTSLALQVDICAAHLFVSECVPVNSATTSALLVPLVKLSVEHLSVAPLLAPLDMPE